MVGVTIYTLAGCRYCWRAKRLLRRRGVRFEEISTSGKWSAATAARRVELDQRFGRTKFPQILIGERHIGGWRELIALERSGRLDDLLGSATEGGLSHPVFARVYTQIARMAQRTRSSAHRRRLVAGLHGRVVEVGAGSGANFLYYPPSVTEVIAVEPEPTLRREAERAAAQAPVPVRVVAGLAEALPFDDCEIDAAVLSLVMCSVESQERALDEVLRVLVPGGELRFYEHVAAHSRGMRWFQSILDRTFWPKLVGGCHLTRDTVSAIAAAGFDVEQCERWFGSPRAWELPTPHVLGRARATAIDACDAKVAA
jgi:glutaredoxin/ubiquinone/menaquinone biosynthesis C-methylase UbiE